MKRKLILFVSLLGIISCAGQQGKTQSDTYEDFSKMGVVGERVNSGGKELVSLNIPALSTDIFDVPLSYFTEELNIVKLENKDVALIGGNQMIDVYENYILAHPRKNSIKLFNKEGKFLTTVGNYGRGPSEYLNIYDLHLDEKYGVIYVLPWQSDKLLRFGLDGKPMSSIPLPQFSAKGKFSVDTKNQKVSFFVLPFSNLKYVAWTQDFEGNILGSTPSGSLAVKPDYSNELTACGNNNAFSSFIFVFGTKRIDTLYNITQKGQLEPKFSLSFGKKKPLMHDLFDTKNNYLGQIFEPKKISDRVSTTQNHINFMVNKQTLKGGFISIYDDTFLSNRIAFPSFYFRKGYYVNNFDPAVLSDLIVESLKDKNISNELKTKLTKLSSEIDPNGNNYIVYAKLKE